MITTDNDPGQRRRVRIVSFLRGETGLLAFLTVTGLVYNVGMTAGPYFEGQLAGCLADILGGARQASDMMRLAGLYAAVILVVQGSRAGKRFFVRRFANHVNRRMRAALYHALVHQEATRVQAEGTGALMTKAVTDVDLCTEGIRKFTTELFDTGVVMVAYLGMLVWYDARLALLACVFLPLAYLWAARWKRRVAEAGSAARESEGALAAATMDRIGNEELYRVNGVEARRNKLYETELAAYERASIRSGVLENAMLPLYRIVSLAGVVPIFWIGGGYVLAGRWDIAAFTAFFSCFLRFAVKSSHAAKLFNAVQKAQVSWQRIRPLLADAQDEDVRQTASQPVHIEARNLSIERGGKTLLANVSFSLTPGELFAVTGPVACGKSSLGEALAGEFAYGGSVTADGRELSAMMAGERRGLVTMLHHAPELVHATLAENVALGKDVDVDAYLRLAELAPDIGSGALAPDTEVFADGRPLSGGQQARLAFARTLAHAGAVVVLDDPFASVDAETERRMFANLRAWQGKRIVVLLSSRLWMFPYCDRVLYLADGTGVCGTHEELLAACAGYRGLYGAQAKGAERHAGIVLS